MNESIELPISPTEVKKHAEEILEAKDASSSLRALPPVTAKAVEKLLKEEYGFILESDLDKEVAVTKEKQPSLDTKRFADTFFPDKKSLEQALLVLVPQKYRDFIGEPDVLETMWEKRFYIDQEKTAAEEENREYALALARKLEEQTKTEARKSSEKEKEETLRDTIKEHFKGKESGELAEGVEVLYRGQKHKVVKMIEHTYPSGRMVKLYHLENEVGTPLAEGGVRKYVTQDELTRPE